MRDERGAENPDEEAIEYWRNRQNSLDESDLEQPYQVKKQTPMPQNGHVLNRPGKNPSPQQKKSPNKKTTTRSKRGKPSTTTPTSTTPLQRFEPDIVSSGRVVPLYADTSYEQDEQLVIIARTSSYKEEQLPLPAQASASAATAMKGSPKKRNNNVKSETPESRKVGNYGTTIYNENQEKDQNVEEEEKKQDKAIDEDGGQIDEEKDIKDDGGPFLTCNILNPDNVNDNNNDDHLSDVGSDVDPVSKDQYLQACKLLKSTLIDKERSLAPSEREFLLNLVKDLYPKSF